MTSLQREIKHDKKIQKNITKRKKKGKNNKK